MTPRQKTSVSARCLSIQNLAVNSRVIDGLVGLTRILGTGENYRPKFGPANILLLKNCAQYYGLHHLSKPPVNSLYPLRSLFHISQYSTAPPFSPAAGLGGGAKKLITQLKTPSSQCLNRSPTTRIQATTLMHFLKTSRFCTPGEFVTGLHNYNLLIQDRNTENPTSRNSLVQKVDLDPPLPLMIGLKAYISQYPTQKHLHNRDIQEEVFFSIMHQKWGLSC